MDRLPRRRHENEPGLRPSRKKWEVEQQEIPHFTSYGNQEVTPPDCREWHSCPTPEGGSCKRQLDGADGFTREEFGVGSDTEGFQQAGLHLS
jgi:hypothetical protein